MKNLPPVKLPALLPLALIGALTLVSSSKAQTLPSSGVLAKDVSYIIRADGDRRSNPAGLQCMGSTDKLANQISKAIVGSNESAGEESKHGVFSDPTNPKEKSFFFSARATDPDTAGAGNKRCEYILSGGQLNLEHNKDFWFSVVLMTSDFKKSADAQVIWQWHDASPVPGLSPFLAAIVQGNKLTIAVRQNNSPAPSQANTTATTIYQGPWTPKQWQRFVVKSKIAPSPNGGGYVDVWLNGSPIASYRGPIGYVYDNPADYVKVGIYHWTSGNAWDKSVPRRDVWVKGITKVAHRDGYDAPLIDGLIN